MANDTVYSAGRVLHGNARKVLDAIRRANAAGNEEIRSMNTQEYATAVTEDAPRFLEPTYLHTLQSESFDTSFDRALTYLAQMPTSDVRILGANG